MSSAADEAPVPSISIVGSFVGSPAVTREPRRIAGLHLAYACVVCAGLATIVAPRLASVVLPLSSDQGLYITIGGILNRGGVVGLDTWDTKPPLMYYLYAGLLKVAPDYSTTCTIQVPIQQSIEHKVSCAQLVLSSFDVLYAMALSTAVWWLGRRLYGDAAGAIAGLLCAFFGSMLQITNGGGIADLYLLLPGSLAYAAAFSYERSSHVRWLLLAGVLGGVAGLIKQTGLIVVAAIGTWVVGHVAAERGTRTLASALHACGMLALGAGVVLAAAAILLARVGALNTELNQALLFNIYYVTRPANVNSFVVQFLNQSWAVFSGSQSGLWIAALVGLCMFRGTAPERGRWLLLDWLGASAASIVAGGAQLHVNYYLALVSPMSILGGYALARLWQTPGVVVRVALLALCTVLVRYSSQFQDHQYGNAWYSRIQSNTHSTEEFVAGAIGGGAGSLFVWGNGPQVYALTGRRPASRYLHTIGLSYDYAFHTELQQNRSELMATLESSPPQVIAIDTPWLRRAHTLDFPELEALIARGYELTNTPANPIFDGWRIYRRGTSS
jgi:dolichyl-phosphate-mannose-protein mannosyltransferase